VKLRGVGFVKEVGFKPGVKERGGECQCSRSVIIDSIVQSSWFDFLVFPLYAYIITAVTWLGDWQSTCHVKNATPAVPLSAV